MTPTSVPEAVSATAYSDAMHARALLPSHFHQDAFHTSVTAAQWSGGCVYIPNLLCNKFFCFLLPLYKIPSFIQQFSPFIQIILRDAAFILFLLFSYIRFSVCENYYFFHLLLTVLHYSAYFNNLLISKNIQGTIVHV